MLGPLWRGSGAQQRNSATHRAAAVPPSTAGAWQRVSLHVCSHLILVERGVAETADDGVAFRRPCFAEDHRLWV